MWEPQHRRAAERNGLRYPNDLTDAEWDLIAPSIPPAKRGGRRRAVDVREVLNAIFYVLSTGCQWKALPKDLPPKSTAHYYFMLWDWDGTLDRIHHALYVEIRELEERSASLSVAIVDSQSAAQKGEKASIRKASMRARRSWGASATSSSIRSVFCRMSSFIPLRSRIATVRLWCSTNARDGCSLSSGASMPMADIKDRAFAPQRQEPAIGRLRPSNAATSPRASWSCSSDGSSSARLPGSTEIADWPATSSATQETAPPSSVSP